MARVSSMPSVSHERLLHLLTYDPLTGLFTRNVGVKGAAAGSIAGCWAETGYVLIGVDHRLYAANQLAWFYMTGKWAAEMVDHKDTVRSNNVWTNLREATNQENSRNKDKNSNNTSGYKGVSFDRARNKWRAQITVDRKNSALGRYETKELALAAYEAAAKLHFGEFYREQVA